jgi:hypothetical protein
LKTGNVTRADLARSVLSVPPPARHADLTLNATANRAVIRHLEAGGVSTLLYGGNADFYSALTGRLDSCGSGGPMSAMPASVNASHPKLKAAATALLAHDRKFF